MQFKYKMCPTAVIALNTAIQDEEALRKTTVERVTKLASLARAAIEQYIANDGTITQLEQDAKYMLSRDYGMAQGVSSQIAIAACRGNGAGMLSGAIRFSVMDSLFYRTYQAIHEHFTDIMTGNITNSITTLIKTAWPHQTQIAAITALRILTNATSLKDLGLSTNDPGIHANTLPKGFLAQSIEGLTQWPRIITKMSLANRKESLYSSRNILTGYLQRTTYDIRINF